jgi:hypothetical protein
LLPRVGHGEGIGQVVDDPVQGVRNAAADLALGGLRSLHEIQHAHERWACLVEEAANQARS